MEIFAFKVGVGPNGPQQYLIGLKDFSLLSFKDQPETRKDFNFDSAVYSLTLLWDAHRKVFFEKFGAVDSAV